MKEILKFMLVIVFFSFFSCNKSLNNDPINNTKSKDLAKNYLNFFRSKKADGSVLIQSSTTTAMQGVNKNITFTEKKPNRGLKSKMSNRIEIKGFSNKDLRKTRNSTKDYYNLFGKKLSYRIVDESNSNRTEDEYQEVYIPKLIDVTYNTEGLVPGTVVSWNVDDLNLNGVVVSVEYYAINQLDTKLAFDNISTIKRSFVLDDSLGSYTITQEDLEIFPNNAILDINVLRAGFDTDENSDVSIGGLTKVGDSKLVQY